MTLRRAVITAATYLVAVMIALGVPFAQLQTATVDNTCCCPDPDTCKCPDHQPGTDTPSMRACHKDGPVAVQNHLDAFVPPVVVHPTAPARIAHAVPERLTSPHAPPAPRRPDAPS